MRFTRETITLGHEKAHSKVSVIDYFNSLQGRLMFCAGIMIEICVLVSPKCRHFEIKRARVGFKVHIALQF